jgi:hypothetical protein
MIPANQLPPKKSVYDLPSVLPGMEPTPEQIEQASLAQIAGIVLAVANAKTAISATATMHLVALLRAANLLTEAGVAAFAKAAAAVVRAAVRQSQEVTWSGVAARTQIVGVRFDGTIPKERDIPEDLRFSRGSDLEVAYARVAREYKKNLERKPDDPIIRELVAQYEDELVTPIPRPDNISSDAVERVADGTEEWVEAFRKASEAEGGTDPEGPSDYEISTNSLRERRAIAKAEREAELQKLASEVSDARRESKSKKASSAEGSGDTAEPEEPTLTLTDSEVSVVIERYAEQKAEELVERMVSQDVAGSSRNIYKHALDQISAKDVIGFRRVVHPELSQSGRSCGLCIVASTMEYKRGDLLPIHSGCNCETCEIYSVNGEIFDPGGQINFEDLEVFYREAGNTTHGWSLKRQKYKVVDHPEYGPTLVNDHPNKRGNIKKESVPFNG